MSDAPDFIWAWVWDLPYPSRANTQPEWSAAVFPSEQSVTDYVRRDPAVLAALPEVQAMVAAAVMEALGRANMLGLDVMEQLNTKPGSAAQSAILEYRAAIRAMIPEVKP